MSNKNKLTKDQKREKKKRAEAAIRQQKEDAKRRQLKSLWSGVDAEDDFTGSHFTVLLKSLALEAGEPPKDLIDLTKTSDWEDALKSIKMEMRLQRSAHGIYADADEAPLGSSYYIFWGEEKVSVIYNSIGLLAHKPGTLDEAMREEVRELRTTEPEQKVTYGAFLFSVPLHSPPDQFIAFTNGEESPHLYLVTEAKGLTYLGNQERAISLIRFFGRNFKNGADIDAGVKAVETQIDRHEKSDPDAIWREAEKYKSLIEQLGSGLAWEKNLLCRGAEIEITRLESDLSSTKADIERLSAEARESESARRRAERSLALAEAKIRGMETRLATARPISQAETAKTEPARKPIPARMSDLFGITP